MAHYNKNAGVEDYRIKSERLCIPFSIVANATPASKTSSNDLPGAMVLAMEGLTASAAAIDSGTNFTTPVDSTGIFGILVYNLGTVAKLHKAEVVGLSSGSVAVSAKGASTSGVTASGNVAVSVDWSGDLSSTNLSGVLCIDYIISEA
jgi:hypothetical protein